MSSGDATERLPFVRIVVISFDNSDLTLACLASLDRLDYPAHRREVVVVDNGSLDGAVARIRAAHPAVRVVEPLRNLGFSGGCNAGIRAHGSFDYVALINNDAMAEPHWLTALVDALDHDSGLGAAGSKMLFAGSHVGCRIDAPLTLHRGRYRRHRFGVRLSGAELEFTDGERLALADADLTRGRSFSGVRDRREGETMSRWTSGPAELHVDVGAPPFDRSPAGAPPRALHLRLSALAESDVRLGDDVVRVGTAPAWCTVPLRPYAIVNNAGSCLFSEGFGGDRGFGEADRGQYEEPVDVFAWCGGAVLLRRAYLDAVGLFDERFFLYYEDTDLSWRGQLAGWRYRYVPASVVHHHHASSSGEGSDLFRFHVERNRMLMLLKNAPLAYAARGIAVNAAPVAYALAMDLLRPLLRLRRPRTHELALWWRIVGGTLRLAPAMLAARRTQPRVRTRRELLAWEVPR